MAAIYVIRTRVAKVEPRENVTYVNIADRAKPPSLDNTVSVIEPLGWFLHLEGSRESFCIGTDEPPFAAGASVKLTIEVME
jgi:hypothetical protein